MNAEALIPFPQNDPVANPTRQSRGNRPRPGPRRKKARNARKFLLEKGYKLPTNWHIPGSLQHQFHSLIESMAVATGNPDDQSFLIQTHADVNYCFRVAKNLGFKIRTQKQDAGGIRVWRIK